MNDADTSRRDRVRVVSPAFKAAMVGLVAYGVTDSFTDPLKLVNPLRYFTIQSSIALGLLMLYLCVLELRGVRVPSRLETLLRGCVLLASSVTGIVFHVLLAPELPRVEFPSHVLHTILPIAAVLEWLLFERKGVFRYRHIAVWLAYPLAYLSANLVAALFDGFYPYGFMDAAQLGYGGVGLYTLVLIAVFAALGAAYVAVDRLLGRRRDVGRSTREGSGSAAEGSVLRARPKI